MTEMSDGEWESLCDGCGRCCLHKLENLDTGQLVYTGVACRLLDEYTCRCKCYSERTRLVDDCLKLSPTGLEQLEWLPVTCAYRRLSEGKGLEWWHPLVSGDPNTVHEAGISVRRKVVSEEWIHPNQYQDVIVDWVE